MASYTLERERLAVTRDAETILAINGALEHMSEFNDRLAKVVDCRVFVGWTEEETADALGITARTVQRDWARARAWLKTELA